MAYCTKCGKPVTDALHAYCGSCGTPTQAAAFAPSKSLQGEATFSQPIGTQSKKTRAKNG